MKAKDSWEEAQNRVAEATRLAEEGLLLSPEERESLAGLCARAGEELRSIDRTPLRIGLFGGTGVGKSSLINLLAGSEVSAASFHRPYTEQVVAYVHEEARELVSCSGPIPCRTVLHRAEEARRLALFDMPDLDSNKPAHRETVAAASKDLDLCLWVTTPEKYADRAVVSAMEHLDRSRKNYAFAINKADTLAEEEIPALKKHFTKLIGERNFSGAPVFVISVNDAAASLATPGSEGFSELRQWVFRTRQRQEMEEIRARNSLRELGLAMEGIASRLARSRAPEALSRALDEINATVPEIRALARKEILFLADPHAGESMARSFAGAMPDPWPISLLSGLLARLARSGPGLSGPSDPLFLANRLAAADRLAAAAADGMAAAPAPLDLAGILRDFAARNAEAAKPVAESGPGLAARLGAAAKAYLLLAIPTLFFLLAMAGVTSVSDLTPGLLLRKLGIGLANTPLAVFSPPGLAALCALVLVWGLISLRLASTAASRRLALVRKAMARLSDSLADLLMEKISAELARVSHSLEDIQAEARMIGAWAERQHE